METTSLEDRSNELFKKLVPMSGPAETLEGEILRAINRIAYRHYNDGDYWWKGYGIQTCGPAETFLTRYCPIDLPELSVSDAKLEDDYEKLISKSLERIVEYVESRAGNYSQNTRDMWECRAYYEGQEEDED